jgi:signal transduction histidine kinase
MLAAEPQPMTGISGPSPSARPLARRSGVVFASNVALVALIAVLDYVTGYDVRLAILYLFPIALATWRLGAGAGTFMAIASTLAWLVSFASLHPYSHDAYFYWEGAAKAGTFLFIVWLLARLRRALAHSDERFVTVLDGLAAAVFVEDARSGQVLFANPRFRQKFGDARPAMLAGDFAVEYAGEVHDAARHRWYLVRSRPLRWVDGRAVTLRLLSDITEEKRVRELMERHRDALHRSSRLAALGEFASAIAHEINQPLAAIATYNNTCLRLLEAGSGDPTEIRQAMQKCRDQAKRAGAIIQRLRGLLRHPAPDFGPQDLNAVARAALQAAEAEAFEAGIILESALAAQLPPVRSDALLIEQVLLNLLRNAIEAVQGLPPARRRVTIGSAVNSEGGVTLSVADLGDGIAPAIRERLFEPFVTDKPGGLGLGLSICRSVVESHGGSIAVAAASAAPGARFSFTLPGACA